jgi:hypothetical protein
MIGKFCWVSGVRELDMYRGVVNLKFLFRFTTPLYMSSYSLEDRVSVGRDW